MYSDLGLGLLFVAVFVWLLGLTYFVWQGRSFLNSLFPESGQRDIRKKFEEVLGEVTKSGMSLGEMREKIAELERGNLSHIQKVELLRFNPYEDTGGDQSFTVALLNDEGSGLVITSMHSRSGTRVYAKPVKLGKENTNQFSKEEKEVIAKALK